MAYKIKTLLALRNNRDGSPLGCYHSSLRCWLFFFLCFFHLAVAENNLLRRPILWKGFIFCLRKPTAAVRVCVIAHEV